MPIRDLILNLREQKSGHALIDTANDLDRAAAGADKFGDSAKALERDVKDLDTQIAKTHARIKELSAQFAHTGDRSLFGDIRKEKTFLGQLEKVRKELEKIDSLGVKAAAGGGLLGGIPAIGGVPGPLIAAGAGATAALSPAIGGIIAAAVLGGVGTGGLLGGIVAASQDSRVKGAFKDLGRQAVGGFELAATPLEGPLIRAAGKLGEALRTEMPAFTKDFAVLSEAVDPITHSITGFIHELHPGLSAAFKASIPLANQFDKEMTGFGKASTIFLNDMADAAPGAKDALHDLFVILDDGGIALGEFTKELAGLLDVTHKVMDEIPLGDLDTVPWFGIIGMIGKLRGEVGDTGQAMGDATGPADDFRQSLEEQERAAREDARALDRVNDFVRDYFDLVSSRLDAAEHYNRALLDLTDSVRENGTSLAINTREGLANRDVLEDLARATQEMYDQGLLTDAQYQAQIQSLMQRAEALGFNRDEVYKLIGALDRLPKQVVVDAVVKLGGAFDKLFALASLGGANKQGPQQGRGGTDFSITPVVRDPDSRAFLDLPSRDVGGPVLAGRSYRIGGKTGPPEILTMGSSSGSVAPIGSGSAQTTTVVFDFRGTEDAFAAWFRKATRIEGGTGADSVQAAWGQVR